VSLPPGNRPFRASASLFLLCALGALVVEDRSGAQTRERAAAGPSLQAFSSCGHLRSYLRRHREALPYGFDDLRLSTPEAATAAPSAEPQPTPTNVQEQGVDEPDLVKADGSLILALGGERLRAVDVSGEEPRLLDSLVVPQGPGRDPQVDGAELLVAGERALLIVRAYPRTVISEVDVSDPSDLRALRTMTIEGDYVSARLHESTARVVVSAYPELPVAERGNGRAWLPKATLRDRTARTLSRSRLVGCEDVRRPRRFSGAEMLTVLTVDVARGLPAVDTDTVMTGGEVLYASPTSLYVATERWDGAAIDGPVSDVSTAIHRFAIDDPLSTEYAASGRVPGYMLSQWSMSEHEGVLRIASTTSPPWREGEPGRSESLITVLAESSGRLVDVGRVGGLGEGEEIRAMRFIGELGYVVTFRQIDPLYVVDLSDPANPRVRGELKVPGYSAYLHPISETRLLGVGQDADEDGRTLGAQLSLFDVSNLDRPLRVDREDLGSRSRSEVEFNHRAFLFAEPLGLGVLPLTVRAEDGEHFFGAAAFQLGAEGEIAKVTRLAHGDSREEKIRRSLIVGAHLYTVSAEGVMSHDPQTLERKAFLRYGR